MEATLQDLRTMTRAAQARSKDYPVDVQDFVYNLLLEEALVVTSSELTLNWPYRSYQELVLKHGEVRSAPPQTDEFLEIMEPRQCYWNAYTTVMEYREYTYVEGYAQMMFMPVQHAWLEDPDGQVIDPTWAGLEMAKHGRATYAGIRFSSEFVLTHAARTGWTGILAADWRENHRILRDGLVFDDAGTAISIGSTDAHSTPQNPQEGTQ